jgi:hypothetical protein
MAGPYGGASARNFGWGKNLAFAGGQALRARFGGGHFSSQDTHEARWDQAVAFLKAQNIRDAHLIDQAALDSYAAEVADRVTDNLIGVRYAQNLLSTANVVLGAIREDNLVTVSPREWVGARTHVRNTIPGGIDIATVSACMAELRGAGLPRSAAVVGLARSLGLRLRESILADLPRLAKEAEAMGRVNIQEGTKGGRTAPRWVPVTANAITAIQDAIDASPLGSRNLLATGEQLVDLYFGEMRVARAILKRYTIKGFHDLRAAFACARYEQLCGAPAPVIAQAIPDRDRDLAARETVGAELGHGRVDVVGAYVGGRRYE